MKRLKYKKNAFVLLILTVVIAVLAMQIFAMTGISNRFAYDTDRAYLRACSDNLTTSAIAWSKQNSKDVVANKKIVLDVNSLSIKNAKLQLAIDSQGQISIDMSCSKNKLNIHEQRTLKF